MKETLYVNNIFLQFLQKISSEQFSSFTVDIKSLLRVLILAPSYVCRRHLASEGQFMSRSAG
jgi:hypothetical protein